MHFVIQKAPKPGNCGFPLLYCSIHSQRRHQKRVAGTLVAKTFMGIIRSHSLKGNKNTSLAKVPDSIFAL